MEQRINLTTEAYAIIEPTGEVLTITLHVWRDGVGDWVTTSTRMAGWEDEAEVLWVLVDMVARECGSDSAEYDAAVCLAQEEACRQWPEE